MLESKAYLYVNILNQFLSIYVHSYEEPLEWRS